VDAVDAVDAQPLLRQVVVLLLVEHQQHDDLPARERLAVLTDDAALGGVVTALGGTGAQILALRKSEPTLEDVFVELVGRGFGDDEQREAPGDDRDGRVGDERDGDDDAGVPDQEDAESREPLEVR